MQEDNQWNHATSSAPRRPDVYIAVHGGAGVHGHGVEKDVRRVLREACYRALAVVSDSTGIDQNPAPSLSMVESATCVLEDDPSLNAGYGSNLTLDGTVECDAAIMAGRGLKFGSVGSVPDAKNPITLARAILEYSSQPDKLGRIPPLTLVSTGASSFARRVSQARGSVQPQLVDPSCLISPGAHAQYEKWKGRLEDPSYSPPPLDTVSVQGPRSPGGVGGWTSSRSPYGRGFSNYNVGAIPISPSSSEHSSYSYGSPPPDTPQTPFSSVSSSFPWSEPQSLQADNTLHHIQDTVGAVAWHPKDGAAASVSSGGLLLKLPGRVGEAAVYGAGCWAQHETEEGGSSVACSVSGTGEYIVRSSLARIVGERVLAGMTSYPTTPVNGAFQSLSDGDDELDEEEGVEDVGTDPHQILQTVLERDFWGEFHKEGEPNPSAGVLLLSREVDSEGRASVRLWCAFTTPTMAIAYASPNHPKPKAVVLRHPDMYGSRHGTDKPRIFITAIPL